MDIFQDMFQGVGEWGCSDSDAYNLRGLIVDSRPGQAFRKVSQSCSCADGEFDVEERLECCAQSSVDSVAHEGSTALLPLAEHAFTVQMDIIGTKRPAAELLSQSAIEKQMRSEERSDGSVRRRLLFKQDTPTWCKQRASEMWAAAAPAQKWRAIRLATQCFFAFKSRKEFSADEEIVQYQMHAERAKWQKEFGRLPEDEKVLWYVCAMRDAAYKASTPTPEVFGMFVSLNEPSKKKKNACQGRVGHLEWKMGR